MTHRKSSSKVPTNRVNWKDPHLESLLQKTESWQLDNRGSYPSQEVQIHLGWGGGDLSKPALLVFEREQVMVLETNFAIPPGEHLRVDKPFGDDVQTRWGTVVESRAGVRAGDVESNIHVHWMHVR